MRRRPPRDRRFGRAALLAALTVGWVAIAVAWLLAGWYALGAAALSLAVLQALLTLGALRDLSR